MTALAPPRLDAPVTSAAPLTALTTLPRQPRRVSESRTWLRKQLAEWGVHEDDADTAALLLSEVFTNSVLHAAGDSDATLTAALWDGRLKVSVSDPDSAMRVPAPGDEHGRGLEIVNRLASGFGFERMPGGKIVHFTLDLRGSS